MKFIKQIKFFVIVLISHLLISTSGAVAADAYGIESIGDNNLITNSGTLPPVSTSEADDNALGIYSVGALNIITNSGTITVSTSGDDAIASGIYSFGNTNTITNSGTITVSTSGAGAAYAFGIYNRVGDFNTITNSGTITVSTEGVSADALGIYSSGNYNTITNSGTITLSTSGDDAIAYGIYSDVAGNTITNSGTITVSTSGNNLEAFGIYSFGNTNTITNSGTITVSASGASANAYGITSDGDTNTITNSGTITVSTSGNNLVAFGIYSFGNTNAITNSGTITASTIGTNASAYGITSYGTDNTITNSGTITASTIGHNAEAFGIYSYGDTNTITNSGTITVSTSGGGGFAFGIWTAGADNTITNSGTITASNYGIYSSDTGNIITNSGKITAANAIYSNGGSLNILPNSYIDGLFNLTGDTTVNITTGPSHSIYYNLGVTPTFSGPTPGFINGTIAATFDPTVFKGSINELADLNNNIASVANKNLSNFKDRQFSTSVFASQLEHKADAVNLKQEIDQLGVVFAYDYKLTDTNLNFMAGYANSDLEANSRFAKSYANKSKGPFIGVAGIYDTGLVNVNFGLTTGLLKHSHDRFVNDNEATNGEAHAKANYDSMFIAPEIGVSKKIKSNDITFSPKANVRYNYQSVDGYTETGSNSNATVKSLDVGLVETNLELAGTKSLNQSSYTIKTGYLNRQSVGDHKATVTMIGQTNSIGFGDKSNNIYYVGVGADLNLANFKLSFDLNQYLGDAEGFQGMVKLSNNF
jgi:hypothetical protein